MCELVSEEIQCMERERKREKEREQAIYLEVMEYKHRQIDDKNGIFLFQVQFILDQCVETDTQ